MCLSRAHKNIFNEIFCFSLSTTIYFLCRSVCCSVRNDGFYDFRGIFFFIGILLTKDNTSYCQNSYCIHKANNINNDGTFVCFLLLILILFLVHFEINFCYMKLFLRSTYLYFYFSLLRERKMLFFVEL